MVEKGKNKKAMTLSAEGVQDFTGNNESVNKESVEKKEKIKVFKKPNMFFKSDGSPKGAWISSIVTISILVMFWIGIFSDKVALRLDLFGEFLIAFAVATIGPYIIGKGVNKIYETKNKNGYRDTEYLD